MQNQTEHKSVRLAENLILTIFWLIIFSAPIIFQDDMSDLQWEKIVNDWRRLVPFLILSLINHYLLVPIFFFRKKKIAYIVSAAVTLMVFAFILITIQKSRPGAENQPLPREHLPPPRERMHEFRREGEAPPKRRPGHPAPAPGTLPPNVNSFIIALLILGFDTGLRTVFKWTKSEQEKETLEKEKVKSELAFLRNQVSPHFFMNTLNNIHALIDFDRDEAKESIIRLSKLMRHLLYESEDERISIKKEVEFLTNYIDLMRLRFTDKVKVDLHLQENMPEKSIAPMLFTTFIENGFKHGVSYNAPSFINVSLFVEDDQLKFEMQNSNFSAGITSKASGIGLENIKKRLELLYAGKYQLYISNQRDVFIVKLAIPI